MFNIFNFKLTNQLLEKLIELVKTKTKLMDNQATQRLKTKKAGHQPPKLPGFRFLFIQFL
jgi:hypothetical protein